MNQPPSPKTYWHPLVDRSPPNWACEWGEDSYGVFATFRVGDVTQRMRWIPAGTFLMGSPEGEAGRDDDETQHLVTLTKGFWLADTPCTQEMWVEVMGENPSEFVSEQRPVEQVSWDDCQKFFRRLEERQPTLDPRLPTEAEWEHACRAGSRTSTWQGDIEILGHRNAPQLDTMAWYGGNSGVDFELEDGWDTSGWKEQQVPHDKAGTHTVGIKEKNLWGLSDMLGNVWEWCADTYGAYPTEPLVDPLGYGEGGFRVIRGGSWSSFARYVRAAYRNRLEPGYRYGGRLGFRLALGPGRGVRER